MRNLIWGVTGQDGHYLTKLLLSKGEEVIGVHRRTSLPNTERIKEFLGNPKFTLVEGDITDALCVHRIISGWEPDYVYNLAAQSHVGTSFREPSHTFDVTFKGCLNCLDAIKVMNPSRQARFYQASSSEMFGSSKTTFYKDYAAECCGLRTDEEKLKAGVMWYAQNEDTPMLPNSPYAIAKLAAHHAVRMYREAYGIFACSGILFNHESPWRGEEFVTRKITKYVAKYHMGTEAFLLKLGNLKASRDWGHAADYMNAAYLMLQQDKPDDYVVATGETHTVEDFVLAAFAAAGYKFDKIEDCPIQIDYDLFRPSEVPYLRGDSSKARKVLGWAPQVSFSQLVAEMVQTDIQREMKERR